MSNVIISYIKLWFTYIGHNKDGREYLWMISQFYLLTSFYKVLFCVFFFREYRDLFCKPLWWELSSILYKKHKKQRNYSVNSIVLTKRVTEVSDGISFLFREVVFKETVQELSKNLMSMLYIIRFLFNDINSIWSVSSQCYGSKTCSSIWFLKLAVRIDNMNVFDRQNITVQ